MNGAFTLCQMVFQLEPSVPGSHHAIQSPHLGATINLLSAVSRQRSKYNCSLPPYTRYTHAKKTQALDTAGTPTSRRNMVSSTTEWLSRPLEREGRILPKHGAVLGASDKLLFRHRLKMPAKNWWPVCALRGVRRISRYVRT